ncbi:MAG: prefoldin subunit alpha [Candidatus Micrarchaeota archaeon]
MKQHSHDQHEHGDNPRNDGSDQRELQMQYSYVNSQIEQAQKQLNDMRMVLEEIQETTIAITELEQKPKSTIVAIGSNAFVKAQIETDKVIAPIGANVLALKTPEDARKILEDRASKVSSVISNIERALTQLYQMQQRIIDKAQQSQEMQ